LEQSGLAAPGVRSVSRCLADGVNISYNLLFRQIFGT